MEEKVPCNICNSDNTALLFQKDGINVVRCRECDLVYVNPRPHLDILHDQYHDEDYFDYYEQMEQSDAVTFNRRLIKVEARTPPGRLLDLGCARGTFLQVALKRGWQGVGVDISTSAIEHCQSLGLDAHCGNLPDLQFAAESFDFINMEDSIEHLPDPATMIKEVYRLLKPNGWLLVRTPDIGSLIARLQGQHWIQIKPAEHIYYFSGATLKKLLTLVGFTVVKTESLGRVFFWKLVAEKLKHQNRFLGSCLAFILNLLRLNRKTIGINLGDEIGVWAIKKPKRNGSQI